MGCQGEGLGDPCPGQDVLSRTLALPSPVALTKLPSPTTLHMPQFTPLSALGVGSPGLSVR